MRNSQDSKLIRDYIIKEREINNNSALAQPYRSLKHDMSPDIVTIGDHYAVVPQIPQTKKRTLNRKMSKKLLAMRAIGQMESGWSNTISSNLGTFSQPERDITFVRRQSNESNNGGGVVRIGSGKKHKKLRIRSSGKRKLSRQRLHTSISDSNPGSPNVNVRHSYNIAQTVHRFEPLHP